MRGDVDERDREPEHAGAARALSLGAGFVVVGRVARALRDGERLPDEELLVKDLRA